jgi:hypothetical protein
MDRYMSNVVNEKQMIIDQYEDVVELTLILPKSKVRLLALEMQNDMASLSARPLKPGVDDIDCPELIVQITESMGHLYRLIAGMDIPAEIESEEKPPVKKSKKGPAKKAPRKTKVVISKE